TGSVVAGRPRVVVLWRSQPVRLRGVVFRSGRGLTGFLRPVLAHVLHEPQRVFEGADDVVERGSVFSLGGHEYGKVAENLGVFLEDLPLPVARGKRLGRLQGCLLVAWAGLAGPGLLVLAAFALSRPHLGQGRLELELSLPDGFLVLLGQL